MPGLHPIETAPRDASGSNFESLRLMVFARLSTATRQRIGLPSPDTMYDGGAHHVVEFPPLPEAGGAVLQHGVDMVDAARFCAAPVRSLETFAKRLVTDVHWLWRRRARIARRVEEVRKAAEAGIRVADPWATRVELGRILVDSRSIGRADEPTLRVEYLGNDDALRRGRLYATVAGHDIVTAATVMRAAFVHRRRGRQSELLQKLGADGWIDTSAAAIAHAAPEGQAAVLLRLSRDLETLVAVPSADGVRHATLFWRDGVIRAEGNTGRGLSRLWQVVDQRGAMARKKAARRQLSMDHLLDLASRGHGRPAQDGHCPARLAGQSLVSTSIGAIWPEPGEEAD